MVIVPLPSTRFSRFNFALKRFTAQNALYGGLTQVREVADARWTLEVQTSQLTPAEARAWEVWWDSIRGGTRGFPAFHVLREFPASRPNGFAGNVRAGTATAFDGSATVTSTTVNGIGLSGLPASLPFTAGDMVELRVAADRRSLHRVSANVTASSGGAVTLAVEPAINTTVFTAAASTAYVGQPSAIFVPQPDSWSLAYNAREAPRAGFSAMSMVY